MANRFQLASALAVVFGSMSCAATVHLLIREGRNSIGGRNTLLYIAIPGNLVLPSLWPVALNPTRGP